ncbi:BFD/(2Fe-2S)-binding domain-containing protein [Advenella kashmirensis WT001]|uniref:BFD/(2Fe-2S)-binding domain-containing protein n=1 Tax=Advenella kashmirensis (strain DSM 17095 / LMG 22695 / WT001) TaxID=1036672 RepID=I3UH01_ADVKW|nr:FAD-dependent oxidoreductase [Advenella kashmirensis]AFK64289.1 BFD/(2Fe-2S)-binding domain-containing protein [Advenella kashmirensis WT001]
MSAHAPVIVGAGPAGIRAAQVLVQAGLRPIVIDEASKPGGQIYRQQPDGFTRTGRQLYGFEHSKASALHETARQMIASDQIDYRPNTLVWDADAHQLYVIRDGKHDAIAYERVILATGATDRVLPFAGWTLPGVYTLGGAQIALKYQAARSASESCLPVPDRSCIWLPINTARRARRCPQCSIPVHSPRCARVCKPLPPMRRSWPRGFITWPGCGPTVYR